MGLDPGSRLGPYEVITLLGVGGMGEVYRATDTNLKRQVAMKVLPQTLASDAERLARFQREAEVLASLNHPNIAHLYGLEKSGDTFALVMELVEGQTLADRITRGELSLDEVLSIARQIAGALEGAHAQGIIHRDLKPANIKLREDGTVKVLDFGLAKLADTASTSSGASLLTSPHLTQAGLVIGTPPYMSPEQARGQAVDTRADLWAFGCVCFEMLSGTRAFAGDTASDAISAVLTRDPDWSALPAGTPALLQRLLRRCLTRDVARRPRHAGDVRLELEEIASSRSADEGQPLQEIRASRGALIPWTMATLVSLVALWLGWRVWNVPGRSATAVTPTTRVELNLPPGLELFPSTSNTISASPDGQAVAFVGTSGGSRQLFLRRFNEFDPTPVRGTVGATTSTFSSDGRSLAFVTAGGELKTASLADGLVTTVTKDASLLFGVTWVADQLIFTRAGALWTVLATGGNPRQLTKLGDGDQDHAWPSALPDAKTVIFTVETAAGPHVEALTLATGERRVLLNQAARAKLGPEGRLFFYRDDRMLATAFDMSALSPIGSPTPVLDPVPDLGGGTPFGDISPAGLMVFSAQSPERRLMWVSRQGVEEPVNDTSRSYMNPRLSPDGTRIAVQAGAVWVYDLRRNAFERASANVSANAFPMWLTDGTTLIHRSGSGLRLHNVENGQERTLRGTTEFDYPSGFTSDDRTLIFLRSSPETSFDIFAAPLDDTSHVTPLVQTSAYEGGAQLSNDGRWLVYVSNDSGRNEVYVRPFQGQERRWQVSNDGGSQPVLESQQQGDLLSQRRSHDGRRHHAYRKRAAVVCTTPAL